MTKIWNVFLEVHFDSLHLVIWVPRKCPLLDRPLFLLWPLPLLFMLTHITMSFFLTFHIFLPSCKPSRKQNNWPFYWIPLQAVLQQSPYSIHIDKEYWKNYVLSFLAEYWFFKKIVFYWKWGGKIKIMGISFNYNRYLMVLCFIKKLSNLVLQKSLFLSSSEEDSGDPSWNSCSAVVTHGERALVKP